MTTPCKPTRNAARALSRPSVIQQRVVCPDCAAEHWRFRVGDELGWWPDDAKRCAPCAALATYAALPWWRRAFTRKPRT